MLSLHMFRDTRDLIGQRAILPFVGEILKELFGSSMTRDENKILKNQEKLVDMISVKRNATVTISKSFIGITELIDTRDKQTTKVSCILANHINLVDEQID